MEKKGKGVRNGEEAISPRPARTERRKKTPVISSCRISNQENQRFRKGKQRLQGIVSVLQGESWWGRKKRQLGRDPYIGNYGELKKERGKKVE